MITGVDLAKTPGAYITAIFLELAFLGVTLVVVWVKVKHGEFPDFASGFHSYGVGPGGLNHETGGVKKKIPKFVSIELAVGVAVGAGMLFLGEFSWALGYYVTVALFGREYYEEASAGAVDTSPPSLNHFQVVLVVVLMFVVVGACEELFFRGLLLEELPGRSSVRVFIATILFAIYHVPPGIVPLQTTSTFIWYYASLGLVLGLLYLWRGSLLAPIVAHGLFNAVHIVAAFW
ncbi:MAG: CPBP family intramembrane glutamic endopeptidase [Promethearchaeota archaeon]